MTAADMTAAANKPPARHPSMRPLDDLQQDAVDRFFRRTVRGQSNRINLHCQNIGQDLKSRLPYCPILWDWRGAPGVIKGSRRAATIKAAGSFPRCKFRAGRRRNRNTFCLIPASAGMAVNGTLNRRVRE
jgi:hypothetical protein